MVEEQVQSREIVQYGQGVIRRREDRSPDTSDGEGQGIEIVKRTRRNPGREVVLRDTAHEDVWEPVETGIVLRADDTVMDPNEAEGDGPHEGHNQVSQPRRHWAVIVPRTPTNAAEGDVPHEGQNQLSQPQSRLALEGPIQGAWDHQRLSTLMQSVKEFLW
ncbi:hypothetical protein V1522DRAFT_443881 [Lipomyces starkeyi]